MGEMLDFLWCCFKVWDMYELGLGIFVIIYIEYDINMWGKIYVWVWFKGWDVEE